MVSFLGGGPYGFITHV